jgi:hypothetical protein
MRSQGFGVSIPPIERQSDLPESLCFLANLAAGRPVGETPSDEGLAALAIEHRMHGLVVSALHSRDDGVSRALAGRLASIDGETWARHRFLESELTRVTSTLAEADVEHYVIKGIAVERRFYDRMGERPSADLDIVLVSPTKLETALEVLGSDVPDPHLTSQLAEKGWIQSVDVTLASGALVDLHLDPLKLGFQSRFSVSARDHLELMTTDAARIKTLDPTASLVVALIHLNRNRFRHLSGFTDVARILSRSQIDWDAFEHLVRSDGMEVLIDSSLRVVQEELDLDESLVLGWTRANLARRHVVRRVVWNLAWRPSTRLSGLAGRFRMGRRSQFLMPALCRGRLIWLIWWMTRRIFPPAPVLELNHPNTSGPYIVRLVRGRWNQIGHLRLHRRARTRRRDQLVE